MSTYTDLLALNVAYTRVERMSKINSMVLRGESPDQGNRGLDLVKDIIRIPECDMTAIAERFKLTLIGSVLHLGGEALKP